MQFNANKIYGTYVKYIKIQRAWEIWEQNLSEEFSITYTRKKYNTSF